MRKNEEFRGVTAPGYGYRLPLRQARSGCLSKPDWGCKDGLASRYLASDNQAYGHRRRLSSKRPPRPPGAWNGGRAPRPVPYAEAVAAMEARVAAIACGRRPNACGCCEHPSIYTAGTSADRASCSTPGRFPVFKTGRGGRFTYHGPGQRVAYVMLDLSRARPRREGVRHRARRLADRHAGAVRHRRRASSRPDRHLRARRQDRHHRRARAALGQPAWRELERGSRARALLRHRAVRI